MSTFAEVAGGFARIRITPLNQSTFVASGAAVFYTIQDWSVDDEVETGDTTNTEGQATPASSFVLAKEEIPVNGQLRIMLKQASYDPTLNFFGTPLVLTPSLRIMLEIFPFTVLSTPYAVPKFLIKKRRYEGRAGGLQPITLEGVSLGAWTEPT